MAASPDQARPPHIVVFIPTRASFFLGQSFEHGLAQRLGQGNEPVQHRLQSLALFIFLIALRIGIPVQLLLWLYRLWVG